MFNVGDKVVLTEQAKVKFKTAIEARPTDGWNADFVNMVFYAIPQYVHRVDNTGIVLGTGAFYVGVSDLELVEQYNPDEAKPPEVVALGKELKSTDWTDKHYDAFYHLTPKDIENGFVKVDPYFVARIWQLGKKDDSGVLFHNLKNISRYGEKNSKEREIRALYAQIKRLAELEEIEL